MPDAIFSSVGTISGNQSMVISGGSVSFGEECGENAISIFDMNGKLVKSAFKFGRISMDTGDLHPGIYVVSAYSDDENVVNRKFIKKINYSHKLGFSLVAFYNSVQVITSFQIQKTSGQLFYSPNVQYPIEYESLESLFPK